MKQAWQNNEIGLGKKWNEISLVKNEIISYEKVQKKEWNSLAKEWNSFHFTCLGISYHISSWQKRYECAGKCLGFIIKVVGTTPGFAGFATSCWMLWMRSVRHWIIPVYKTNINLLMTKNKISKTDKGITRVLRENWLAYSTEKEAMAHEETRRAVHILQERGKEVYAPTKGRAHASRPTGSEKCMQQLHWQVAHTPLARPTQ